MNKLIPPTVAGLKAFQPERMPFLSRERLPRLEHPGSQLCTANQFDEPSFERWCAALREPVRYSRKLWEFVYVCEVLQQRGMLSTSRRGLGFGVGKEPLAAMFASLGCEVVATDLDLRDAASADWTQTDQHATQLDDLNSRGICDAVTFAQRVQFRAEDMNRISSDLVDFDFTWSACAFEHLGSIKHGLDFFVNSLSCLRRWSRGTHDRI